MKPSDAIGLKIQMPARASRRSLHTSSSVAISVTSSAASRIAGLLARQRCDHGFCELARRRHVAVLDHDVVDAGLLAPALQGVLDFACRAGQEQRAVGDVFK